MSNEEHSWVCDCWECRNKVPEVNHRYRAPGHTDDCPCCREDDDTASQAAEERKS